MHEKGETEKVAVIEKALREENVTDDTNKPLVHKLLHLWMILTQNATSEYDQIDALYSKSVLSSFLSQQENFTPERDFKILDNGGFVHDLSVEKIVDESSWVQEGGFVDLNEVKRNLGLLE